ncbi:glutathione S-transferase family protein [Burkholderia cepacia]|uniref:glutathione S-transferase family protein n=1 Tax=Burkholderia cepacia TaxID=292 RepID=UPI002AB716E5|nr:glutathione S-transferase family protein [Burkholderia cepacia]
MKPIVFFSPGGCSLGAVVAAEWSGQDYKLCQIPLGDEAASRSYRRINPLGQTPSMRIGDKVLGQSLAVLRHIAAKSSDPRMGVKSGVAADRFNMMLGFLHTSFFGAFTPLWMALHGASEADKLVYTKMGSDHVRLAHEKLELLMGNSEWLAGDVPTVADAYFAGIVRWNDVHKAIDQSQFSKITALRERLDKLPGIQFGYAVESGQPATSEGGFRGFVTIDAAAEGTVGVF